MSKDRSDISNSPGLILRTAREELKLSIDAVAHELHLRACVVQAIEAENYDDFSSDVFLKGYFRSYCRLVNLHEERMIELLDSQLKMRKKEIEDVALNAKKAEQVKVRKKLAGVSAALAMVAGLSFYVLVYLLPDSEKGQVDRANAGESSVSTAVGKAMDSAREQTEVNQPEVNQASEVQSSETGEEPLESGVVKVQVAEPVMAEKTSTNAAQTLENEKKNLVTRIREPEPVSATESVAATKNAELAYTNASFEAVFNGDCWFKFANAEGKTVFAALKRAGDKVQYSGPAPFSIVFGDATQVSVTFDGLPVDLKPHTARNGRAQIELKPAS